jgi:hypothetical protein
MFGFGLSDSRNNEYRIREVTYEFMNSSLTDFPGDRYTL